LKGFFYTITLSVLLRELGARERRSLVEHVTGVTAGLLGLAASLGGLGSSGGGLDGSGTTVVVLVVVTGSGGRLDGGSRLSGSLGGGGSGRVRAGASAGGSGGGRSRAGRATGHQLGTGDGVAGGVAVEVELDTGIVSLVEAGTSNTSGLVGAGRLNLEVEALGVVLGTVLLASGVESDDLVTEDVVTGLDGGRDGNLPGVASGNEVVGGEVATGGHTGLSNLEELEALLVNLGAALSTASSEVVNDGTLVGLGPGVPLDGDLLTGLDLGGLDGVLGTLVADDVGITEGGRLNETVIGVLGEPGNELLARVLVGSGTGVETVVVSATDGDGLDVAVSTDTDSGDESGEKGLGEERHFEDCVKKLKCLLVKKVVVIG
jgi:hypothetical protein